MAPAQNDGAAPGTELRKGPENGPILLFGERRSSDPLAILACVGDKAMAEAAHVHGWM